MGSFNELTYSRDLALQNSEIAQLLIAAIQFSNCVVVAISRQVIADAH